MQASSDDGDGPITGINVTPLVDVTLVVLIIMMATAPLIARRAIKVDVPRTAHHDRTATDALTVALDAKRALTLSGRGVTRDQLIKQLSEAVRLSPEQPVTVAADKSLPYGEVTALLDDIRAAGVHKVGLEVVRK